MKIVIYSRFLAITSLLLNVAVKHHFWAAAKWLIEVRKRHIAKEMRVLVHA